MGDEEIRWRRRCEGLLGIPATEGNELTLLRNGDEIFPAMLAAIDAAERTVDFLTSVYWSGEVATRFADALAARAKAGAASRIGNRNLTVGSWRAQATRSSGLVFRVMRARSRDPARRFARAGRK